MPVFSKLLIANRGEIACRIIRTARAKGYRTVAVYSEADACAPHVGMADEAFVLGPSSAAESYLNIDRILAAAAATGADAIHPGYGFLSESAAFADACMQAGLVFVGPSAEAVRVMGDKAEAKRAMVAAGVPCVPGYHGEDQSNSRLIKESALIGFPLMAKAVSGGGGRGMRLVHKPAQLSEALSSARSEAQAAFGNDRLLLERAVIEPRHIEIQVFADNYGSTIHLGERDCSVQRRHQKVIEEAPSSMLTAELRRAMGEAAVQAAKAVNYVGAGTVEFLLDGDQNFYFLEMNTRLQVEHTVTEEVTGLDLVALQLDVAAGKPLPLGQEDLRITGHAIEVRLYAEDPRNEFLPQTGDVLLWKPAGGEGVRVDAGIASGGVVSSYYDPMVAKIIAYGADREEARRRLIRAVGDTVLLGVTTNKAFLIAALSHPQFTAGEATTGFIERYFADGLGDCKIVPPHVKKMLAAAMFGEGSGQGWHSADCMTHHLKLVGPDGAFDARIARGPDGWQVDLNDEGAQVKLVSVAGAEVRYAIGGHLRTALIARTDDTLFIDADGESLRFEDHSFAAPSAEGGIASGTVRAPMNGKIIALDVAAGDRVTRGQSMVTLEAMKMEQRIIAPFDGVVSEILVAPGVQVAARAILVILIPDTP